MKTTFILGAGFSKNSGIPVQSEIPELLIDYNGVYSFEVAVSRILERFFADVFGYMKGSSPPALDDLMTCIDISTNSGHCLGIGYSPLKLRAVRRLLVYRLFSILEKSFKYSAQVEMLLNMISRQEGQTSFIVLNWDTVVERYLLLEQRQRHIDYCSRGSYWRKEYPGHIQDAVRVIKVHGSCNWLYCDNCRSLFYDLGDDIPLLNRAGFMHTDFEAFEELKEVKPFNHTPCLVCGNAISSHIGTFSYRKSFRTNSFPEIWNAAEKELANSDRWVFIGYSLPEADYEFKHLLKIAELKLEHMRKKNVTIDVVLLDSKATAEAYKKFFGRKINSICNGGISEYLELLDKS